MHLGMPAYAWRALKMWRRSWISREVLLYSLFFGGLVALTGLSMLTRSNGAILLLPFLLAARPIAWCRLSAWRPVAVLLGCAALVVLPWTVRNVLETKALVPISDQDGYTLAGTYNQTSRAHDGVWIVATLDPSYARLVQRNRSLTLQ